MPELEETTWKDTTIRHLLTHTHGLKHEGNRTVREFAPGSNWSYKQIGIEALTQIVKRTTNKSVADIIQETSLSHWVLTNPIGIQRSTSS
ncbi:MAG: serine hydrolase [Bacillota bacterium]